MARPEFFTARSFVGNVVGLANAESIGDVTYHGFGTYLDYVKGADAAVGGFMPSPKGLDANIKVPLSELDDLHIQISRGDIWDAAGAAQSEVPSARVATETGDPVLTARDANFGERFEILQGLDEHIRVFNKQTIAVVATAEGPILVAGALVTLPKPNGQRR